MRQPVQLIETYFAGLQLLPDDGRDGLAQAITDILEREGRSAAFVFIPHDEVILVLAWPDEAAGLGEMHDLDARMTVQRVVDGYLVLPQRPQFDAWDTSRSPANK